MVRVCFSVFSGHYLCLTQIKKDDDDDDDDVNIIDMCVCVKMIVLTDPVQSRCVAVNTTIVVTFSERLLLAERVIYVTVAAILAWFVFEVRVKLS